MTVTMKVKELETTSAIDIYVAILCGLSKTILLMRTSMESFVKQVAKAKRMCTIHVNFWFRMANSTGTSQICLSQLYFMLARRAMTA